METSVWKSPELLSPAGSFESLTAAMDAGCDAVYFGVEQLNMRVRAAQFITLEDLPRIAEMTRERGVRAYLTLNTILYDHDIRLMQQITSAAKAAGLDAIIAADVAALMYAREIGMPVHLSTQANVTNAETIQFYSAFADAVVLARELTLTQVESIAQEISRKNITGPSGQNIRLEVFAHGALCMAVSGKCYLSLHSHNASANRGACIQNCRRTYIVTDKEDGNELEIDNEYIMSAKDLCTIGFLDKLLAAGVQILKIEGRGRPADYVHTVTRCYREAIDAVQTGTYNEDKIAGWNERLATVYNRGFWDGYYLGRKMGEWSDVHGSKATQKKLYAARGLKYYDRAGVAEFLADSSPLQAGTRIMVTGPTTGYQEFELGELRVDGKAVAEVRKGEIFTTKVPVRIRPSDKLYKIVPA
ncbi:MAG: U32 family peptidase [Saprospiraceae bacterium]|nr:U32 family peptidase [Saprospiraceae bacterium]